MRTFRSERHPRRRWSTSLGRLTSILLVTAASSSLAGEWRGIEPGKSTPADLRKAFGTPTRIVAAEQYELHAYYAEGAISGTAQTHFRVHPETQTVSRIDVFPAFSIDQPTIENTYGGRCGSPGLKPGADCYLSNLSRAGELYWFYPASRMAVFFRGKENTVLSISYLAPPAPTASPPSVGTPAADTEAGLSDQQSLSGFEESGADEGFDEVAANTSSFPNDSLGADAFAELSDPLTVGGLVYLRGGAAIQAGEGRLGLGQFEAPMLLELFVDGRPNDRVRGFASGRLWHDPIHRSATLLSQPPRDALRVELEQLWLRFDIGRTVFVTLGRQHLRWGATRFWNPADYLHPARANPLDVFDSRVGVEMVKLHMPWEGQGANFYVVGVMDTQGSEHAPLRGGIALRAESPLGPSEVGLTAMLGRGRKPRFGADVSAGVGPVELSLDVAVQQDAELPLYRTSTLDESNGVLEQYQPDGPYIQSSAGVLWEHPFDERNRLTLGAEGLYNPVGYQNKSSLAPLVLAGAYRPLYAGRYYVAGFATFHRGDSVDSAQLTLTHLMNVSDRSQLTRLDLQVQLLASISIELFGAVHHGQQGGELRFSIESASPPLVIPPPFIDLGLGFRLKI